MNYNYNRKKTKEIKIGNRIIGGENPILIQSMTNTLTKDADKTIKQIKDLEEAGCEIVRVTVPDMDSAIAIEKIKNNINIPLVADIHFDYKLAIAVMERGIDKVRINPGNIGDMEKVTLVTNMAKKKNIPIRIGVNSGSLEKEIVEKYHGVTPQGIVESAMNHVKILENLDFENIIISLKSSSVPFSIEAYTIASELSNYPLHVGITESGTVETGSIKSSAGIASILSKGIGDTIRVSLTGDPVEEIKCGKNILKAMELRTFGPTIISCPTCGRTEINLISIANEVENRCKKMKKNIKIAVMGCVVNGPGEARGCDIGIAGGKGVGMIFKNGEVLKKVEEDKLLETLLMEIDKL